MRIMQIEHVILRICLIPHYHRNLKISLTFRLSVPANSEIIFFSELHHVWFANLEKGEKKRRQMMKFLHDKFHCALFRISNFGIMTLREWSPCDHEYYRQRGAVINPTVSI